MKKNTPIMASTVADQARTMWLMRLYTALRTAMACAIVGTATLYGPEFFTREIKFAAFSYLTAAMIITNASVGDTLRGCWHALCATVQVVPLAILVRWLNDPIAGLPVSLAALGVGVAAFMVAVPECTHLTAKRIAFGQIVLVFSDLVLSGDGTSQGFMHPMHVAASTGFGALASLVAVLVPYPGLAYFKVRKLSQVYSENASERMDIFLRAFSARNTQTKMELISQAKPVAETGNKLIQSIKILQEEMHCERPWSRFSVGKLESLELPMRGIGYSLVSSPVLPVQFQEQLSNTLKSVSDQIHQKIEQTRSFPPQNSMTAPETGPNSREQTLLPFDPILPNWVYLFFSCIEMLLHETMETQNQAQKTKSSLIPTLTNWILKLKNRARLVFALKCSLSLSLAMLFGLIFDKENGCWAGLTIAISFVTGKQAVFTIANTRAQGTAIGSVYGVICCFIFHSEEAKLFALLPWIIFTSLLRHSKMYGQTGGFSAAIGALLILGRKNYGSPHEFAIARLTEVFIGLLSFVIVEVFLQPTRAATLAKRHMHLTLQSLRDCVQEMGKKDLEASKYLELREKQKNFESMVCEFEKFVLDAEMEPDFWYLPFRRTCYQSVAKSLSNIVDLLHFVTYNLEVLSELPESCDALRIEFREQMKSEWETFEETLSTSLRFIEKAESVEAHIEAGKVQNREKLVVSIREHEEGQRTRGRSVQCLGAIEFCIGSLRKEIDEIEIDVKAIVQWENHSI